MTGGAAGGEPGSRVCFSSLRKVLFWAFSACRSWRARSFARLLNVVRELPATADLQFLASKDNYSCNKQKPRVSPWGFRPLLTLHYLDVLGLQTLGAGRDFELDGLAFLQAAEAFGLNR